MLSSTGPATTTGRSRRARPTRRRRRRAHGRCARCARRPACGARSGGSCRAPTTTTASGRPKHVRYWEMRPRGEVRAQRRGRRAPVADRRAAASSSPTPTTETCSTPSRLRRLTAGAARPATTATVGRSGGQRSAARPRRQSGHSFACRFVLPFTSRSPRRQGRFTWPSLASRPVSRAKETDSVNITKRRGAALVGGLAALAWRAACGSDNSSRIGGTTTHDGRRRPRRRRDGDDGRRRTTTGGATTTAARGGGATTTVKVSAPPSRASGATFPQAVLRGRAIAAFTKANSGATINYGGGGSGKGRQDLADKVVDFAGSDAPSRPSDKPKFKGGESCTSRSCSRRSRVSYNLSGVDKLQLSADDDRQDLLAPDHDLERSGHRRRQPGRHAARPGHHRGRTAPTARARPRTSPKYLDAAVGDRRRRWTLKSGSTVEWPADTQAGNGNAGVAQIISATDGRHRLRRPLRREGREPEVRRR